MENARTRLCTQLIRAYGEPFLQYIFALGDQPVSVELLADQSPEILEELRSVAIQPTLENTFEQDVSLNAMRHFLLRSNSMISRAIELRLEAGGSLPDRSSCDDDFLERLFDYAYLCWPAVALLCGWQDSVHRFGVSTGFHGENSNPKDVASRALLDDPDLSRLFPNANQDRVRSAVAAVTCDWTLSLDPGGMPAAFVGSVIDQMLLISAVRLAASGAPWTFENFWSRVDRTVSDYRGLARGEEVTFPCVVGLGGLPQESFEPVLFMGDHTIRRAGAIDSHFLGQFGRGSHTVTLELPTRILILEWIPPDRRNKKVITRHPADVAEEELDLLRLAILIGSGTKRPIGTTRYFTHFFNPRSPGGMELWSSSSLEISLTGSDQDVSRAAVQNIVSEYQTLRRLLNDRDDLRLPLRRLLQAAGNRSHPDDSLVDAFVAIEALLNPGRNAAKLTEKILQSIAWLLEPGGGDSWRGVYREAERLYDLRSKIVHGSRRTPRQVGESANQAVLLAARVFKELCHPDNLDLLEMRASERNERLFRRAQS